MSTDNDTPKQSKYPETERQYNRLSGAIYEVITTVLRSNVTKADMSHNRKISKQVQALHTKVLNLMLPSHDAVMHWRQSHEALMVLVKDKVANRYSEEREELKERIDELERELKRDRKAHAEGFLERDRDHAAEMQTMARREAYLMGIVHTLVNDEAERTQVQDRLNGIKSPNSSGAVARMHGNDTTPSDPSCMSCGRKW